MRGIKPAVVGLAVFGLVFVVVLDLVRHRDDPAPTVGHPAPEIVGTDVQGRPLTLSSHRGKVVVLDFWGFW